MDKKINIKLNELKSPNPDVREGAYSFFLKFFEQENSLTHIEKMEMLETTFSNEFLFLEIEKGESKSSVARSFSLLLINLIFYSDDDFKLDGKKYLVQLKGFLAQEKDMRREDAELGFVHIFPHYSDLLLTLNWHKGFSEKEVIELASLFQTKILNIGRDSFCDEDWQRMDDALKQII